MLDDLDLELNAAGIHLAFAELQSSVRDMIVRYGLLETIDRGPPLPLGRRGGRGLPPRGRDRGPHVVAWRPDVGTLGHITRFGG